MVYQSIVYCAALLSFYSYSLYDRINQKIRQTITYSHSSVHISQKPLCRWIQITDEQEKRNLLLNACNPIIKEGRSLSPDGKHNLKLTRHDLTHTASYYYLSLRDTITQKCLIEEEFEHTQSPILFFTSDNKPAIKLGTIINVWDSPKSLLPVKIVHYPYSNNKIHPL